MRHVIKVLITNSSIYINHETADILHTVLIITRTMYTKISFFFLITVKMYNSQQDGILFIVFLYPSAGSEMKQFIVLPL